MAPGAAVAQEGVETSGHEPHELAQLGAGAVAATEHEIAEALATVMSARLTDAGRPPGAARTWAYGVVGMVQLATHWWSTARTVPATELVEQLVALADGRYAVTGKLLAVGPAGELQGIARRRLVETARRRSDPATA